jgi:hypothetical protein
VVYENDVPLESHTFRKIPTLELKSNVDKHFLSQLNKFLKRGHWIPCEKEIHKVEEFQLNLWLQRMLVERLERKSTLISELLNTTRGDWEQTFLITLSRAFGFKYNALPFEQLAANISIPLLQKSKNIEALTFGISGLLPEVSNDYYTQKLIADFTFQKKKWNLNSITKQSWKTGGLRPYNSPFLRLAQFSKFLESFRHGLLQEFLAIHSVKELRKRFQCTPNEFWQNHVSFDKYTAERKTNMSKNAIDSILMNAVIPFLFVYGRELSKPEWEERALEMLQQLSPDQNSIINNWKKIGLSVKSSADSQALLELYQNYCSPKKCLFCAIGTKVLKP